MTAATPTLHDDIGGLAVAAGLLGWAGLQVALGRGDARGLAGVVLAGVAALVAARAAAAVDERLPAALVVAAGLVVVVVWPGILTRGPLSGPFAYSNASGAFMAQVAAAAVILAGLLPRGAARVTAAVLAAAAGLVPVWLGTQAATVTVLLVVLGAALGHRSDRRDGRTLAAAGLAVVVAAHVLTAAAGVVGVQGVAERRVALWGDGIDLLAADPLLGAGPGAFPTASPTALSDRDTPFAHGELIELGATLGVPGLLLGAALMLWWFRRLGRARLDAVSGAAIGAATGLWLHASIDYVLHVPAVVAAAGAVLAAATAPRRGSSAGSPRG